MPPPTRNQVFISYSHKDTKWREDLKIHLKPYRRVGSIISWSDEQITPGSQWLTEITTALTNTKVAVLLVSPDFIASDFIHENELGPLLKEAEQGGVKILWVPIRDSAYKRTPLTHYQAAVLDPSKPLAAMTPASRDKAWVRICEEIEKAVKKARKPRLFPSVDQAHSTPWRASSLEVQANIESESKRRLITSIEFTLECPFTEFDEEKFKSALKIATGIDATQIRIASIRRGSTIIQIDGEQDTLATIIRKIRFSPQIARQLALKTGMRKIAWKIEGRSYKLTVGERASKPSRVGGYRQKLPLQPIRREITEKVRLPFIQRLIRNLLRASPDLQGDDYNHATLTFTYLVEKRLQCDWENREGWFKHLDNVPEVLASKRMGNWKTYLVQCALDWGYMEPKKAFVEAEYEGALESLFDPSQEYASDISAHKDRLLALHKMYHNERWWIKAMLVLCCFFVCRREISKEDIIGLGFGDDFIKQLQSMLDTPPWNTSDASRQGVQLHRKRVSIMRHLSGSKGIATIEEHEH